jgi:hypothetical protein
MELLFSTSRFFGDLWEAQFRSGLCGVDHVNGDTPNGDGDVLERLTMAALKTLKTRNGVAWTATLKLDGKPFAAVEDAGRGGCLSYMPKQGTMRDFLPVLKQLQEAATEATGLKYEALDMVLCCMDPKTPNAADAVPIAIKAIKAMG